MRRDDSLVASWAVSWDCLTPEGNENGPSEKDSKDTRRTDNPMAKNIAMKTVVFFFNPNSFPSDEVLVFSRLSPASFVVRFQQREDIFYFSNILLIPLSAKVLLQTSQQSLDTSRRTVPFSPGYFSQLSHN